MRHKAVVLFNLGGPDNKDAIEPFLFNFFTDKNIINLPYPFRWLIAKLISVRRSRNEAGSSYAELGYKSPLLENTNEQAAALQKLLGSEYKVYVCMRYWHPQTAEIVNKVKENEPEEIILLPLYPQYSTTTTKSSIEEWKRVCDELSLRKPTSTICCYPRNKGFIKASSRTNKASFLLPVRRRAIDLK